mgnify:CR=1 FL=1
MVGGIMSASALSTVLVHFADVLGMYLPELQLYCCHTRLQYLADGAVHDLDYLPYLVALVPFGKIAPSFSIASNNTTRASSERRRLISSRAM